MKLRILIIKLSKLNYSSKFQIVGIFMEKESFAENAKLIVVPKKEELRKLIINF